MESKTEGRSPDGAGPDGASPATAESAAGRAVPAWLRRRVRWLVVVDAVAALAATVLSQLLAFGLLHAELVVRHVRVPYSAAALGVVPAWLMVMAMAGAYDIAPFGTCDREPRRVVNAGVHLLALMAVAYYVAHLEQLGRGFTIAIAPLVTGLTLLGRGGARAGLELQQRRGQAVRRALVIGPREASARLVDQLVNHRGLAAVRPIAALLEDDLRDLRVDGVVIPVLGHPDRVVAALDRTDADLLLITGNLPPGQLRHLTWALQGTGIDVLMAPSLPRTIGLLDVRPVAGLPLLFVDRSSVRLRGGWSSVVPDRLVNLRTSARSNGAG